MSRVPSLLTVGKASPKAKKSLAEGWLTAVLHLAPANSAGMGTLCTDASPECIAFCLNTAGRGGIGLDARDPTKTNAIQRARIRRTVHYKLDRAGFTHQLLDDSDKVERTAARQGLRFAFRPNGTSDLYGLARDCAAARPERMHYDYTKHPRAWERELPNYKLTFSLSEINAHHAKDALAHGMNVAVVFSTKRGRPLPTTFMGRPVLDGDTTDMRFLDPRCRDGYIIGLRAKGRATKSTGNGFVVQV